MRKTRIPTPRRGLAASTERTGDTQPLTNRADSFEPAVEHAQHSAQPPHSLVTFVELLFFAYRDFTGDPDSILEGLDLGRAHHRVVHFVNRHPGLRVADLLVILKITKQSLGRVLKQLIESGYIEQRTGQSDQRERLLFATQKGAQLADMLMRPQLARIAHALNAAKDHEKDVIRRFLFEIITPADRALVAKLVSRALVTGTDRDNA